MLHSTNLQKHWGFQSGRDADKLEAIEFKRSPDGICYITSETNAYISAKVIASMDLGTHSMFIADVIGGEILSEDPSVTYAYYQNNIKAKPAADDKAKKGFICTVCGYLYEGDTLPEDYICPLCKHDASYFVPADEYKGR